MPSSQRPAPGLTVPPPVSATAVLRRCACGGGHAGGECDACRKKREGSLQRSAVQGAAPAVAPPIVHQVLGRSGAPLDTATRGAMESRFSHDFSRVRVHADREAAASADAVMADAYAVGQHVVFAEGQYAPGSEAGRQLLAHELAHVTQQEHAAPAGPQASLLIGPADDPVEREAEQMAARAVDALATRSSPDTRTLRRAPAEGEDTSSDPGLESEQGEEEDDELEDGLTPDASGRPSLEAGHTGSGARVPITPPPGGGRALDGGVRSSMEGVFGWDLSRVRVHDDAAAARSAGDVAADAYTLGSHVYFGAGRYRPGEADGQHLLAHELTHVAQQGGVGPDVLRRRPKGRRRAPDSPAPAKRKRASSGSSAKGCKCKSHSVTCATDACDGKCPPPTSSMVRSPCCGNETCGNSAAASSTRFIRHIDVNLSTQQLTLMWNVGAPQRLLSSPNPSHTPKGSFLIGEKCGACHTNQCGDGMGWFTSFHNGLQFGFHNSQRVAKGVKSHGCVRTPCQEAQLIHDNTSSGVTTVCIHTGGGCGGKGKSGGKTPKADSDDTADDMEEAETATGLLAGLAERVGGADA